MIEHLKLDNVGPAPEMTLDFAPRVNLPDCCKKYGNLLQLRHKPSA